MSTLHDQLESLGIRMRPDPGTFAAYQTRAAHQIAQDLHARLADDGVRLAHTLAVMEQQNRAGKRLLRHAVHRQEEYLATLARLLKVLESASTHHAPTCRYVGAHIAEPAADPLTRTPQ